MLTPKRLSRKKGDKDVLEGAVEVGETGGVVAGEGVEGGEGGEGARLSVSVVSAGRGERGERDGTEKECMADDQKSMM